MSSEKKTPNRERPRITFTFSKETIARVQEEGEVLGKPMSQIVEDAIADYMECGALRRDALRLERAASELQTGLARIDTVLGHLEGALKDAGGDTRGIVALVGGMIVSLLGSVTRNIDAMTKPASTDATTAALAGTFAAAYRADEKEKAHEPTSAT